MAGDAPLMIPCSFDRLYGEVVEFPDRRRVLQAILHDLLPVQDRVDIVPQPREKGLPCHVEQKLVIACHGV